MMEHLLTLRHLGVNEDLLMVFIIAEKLDQETKKQWELHESNEVSISEPLKLDDLLTFLETRVRALQATPLKATAESSETQTKPQSTNQPYLGVQAKP